MQAQMKGVICGQLEGVPEIGISGILQAVHLVFTAATLPLSSYRL